MPRQLSCRGMCKIVTSLEPYFFLPEQHMLLRDVDYELMDFLWQDFQGSWRWEAEKTETYANS